MINLNTKVSREKAALLVIDVQNDFCADNGYFGRNGLDVEPAQKMVPVLKELIGHAREFQIPIIFLRAIYDNPSETILLRHERNNIEPVYCLSGTWGADFYMINPLEHEDVIDKPKYNSFIETNLGQILNNYGIETILCTGTATNVCVETTARDAYSRDYHVVIVEDCCATSYGKVFHDMTMENCRLTFGEVSNSQELIKLWR